MLQIAVAVNNRVLWAINAHNDGTGSDAVGNYDVKIFRVEQGACSRVRPKQVASLRLEGFDRERGALGLARAVLNQIPLEGIGK